MKVSIITVCYNSEKTIRDTIRSVLSQDHDDVEYVIVDGASRDGTMAIVNEYKDSLAVVISERDQGIYDAMNKGIAAASGEIVGILNSDDFYEGNHVISDMVAAFKRDLQLDVVFGDVVFVQPDQLSRIRRHYRAGHFKAWKLRFGWMPPHPGTFIKRAAYERVGGYSLQYKIAADYEMFVRLLHVNKCRYQWINRVIVRMRLGGVSTAGIKSSILLNREIVRACRGNGLYTNLALVLSKIPFKLMELVRRPSL